MRLTAFLFLLCLWLPSLAESPDERVVRAMVAGNAGYTEQQIREEVKKGCDGGVSGDMAVCAWYQYFQEDAKLNDVYTELMERLQERGAREDLRAAQRAWIGFRDAHCRFETDPWEGGSFRTVAIASCREAQTRERMKQIADILACKGGDCHELHERRSSGRAR